MPYVPTVRPLGPENIEPLTAEQAEAVDHWMRKINAGAAETFAAPAVSRFSLCLETLLEEPVCRAIVAAYAGAGWDEARFEMHPRRGYSDGGESETHCFVLLREPKDGRNGMPAHAFASETLAASPRPGMRCPMHGDFEGVFCPQSHPEEVAPAPGDVIRLPVTLELDLELRLDENAATQLVVKGMKSPEGQRVTVGTVRQAGRNKDL